MHRRLAAASTSGIQLEAYYIVQLECTPTSLRSDASNCAIRRAVLDESATGEGTSCGKREGIRCPLCSPRSTRPFNGHILHISTCTAHPNDTDSCLCAVITRISSCLRYPLRLLLSWLDVLTAVPHTLTTRSREYQAPSSIPPSAAAPPPNAQTQGAPADHTRGAQPATHFYTATNTLSLSPRVIGHTLGLAEDTGEEVMQLMMELFTSAPCRKASDWISRRSSFLQESDFS